MAERTELQTVPTSVGMMAVAQQREIAEVQSKLIVARMNPRKRKEALDRILQACTELTLASKALYTYARGGTDITGESIRLAEVLAQNWGNFEFGIRELEQRDGESSVEAYAWDLETNVSERKTFQVPHIRYSREKGNIKLSDPRDIYELTANQGARRMRACILGVIPPDVKEHAVKQCEETLRVKVTVTPERIRNVIDAFGELGVSKQMLETRIQRHIEAITPALIVQLTKIFNSLKDGMSSVSDWFSAPKPEPEKGSLSVADLKPGREENRGHGQEELEKVKDKNADAAMAQAKANLKKKAERETVKAPTAAPAEPGGNPNYSTDASLTPEEEANLFS